MRAMSLWDFFVLSFFGFWACVILIAAFATSVVAGFVMLAVMVTCGYLGARSRDT